MTKSPTQSENFAQDISLGTSHKESKPLGRELDMILKEIDTQKDSFENIHSVNPQEREHMNDTGPNASLFIAKFELYKEQVLNDKNLDRELNLFVEARASIDDPIHDRSNNGEKDIFELTFDIRKNFLNNENAGNSKVLLLTGQAGIGKTFYCKHLQREILFNRTQNPEPEEGSWFPIYVELLSLKNPQTEAISEALTRKLSLTEEEILLLQNSAQNNLHLPRLLFIFDGYDEIENIPTFHSLNCVQDLIKTNFFALNKNNDASWKNAKFIITCREKYLQRVQRRDLLFALIDSESTELSVVAESLLQRKIEPFSDEQITCYLKKYYCSALMNDTEERKMKFVISSFSQIFQTSKLSSWNWVKNFEKMIDNLELRDIARTPFILWIMFQILPKIATTQSGLIRDMNSTQQKIISRRFLLDFIVNEVIRSIAKERVSLSNSSEKQEESKNIQKEENQQGEPHVKEIKQHILNFALRKLGYSLNQLVSESEKNDDDDFSALKLHPLIAIDKTTSRAKFGYPFLIEFLIAKSIEEEINEIVPSIIKDEQLKIPNELLINRRLLTSAASVSIIDLLCDTIKDGTLTTNHFINLIYLSRQKELDHENTGHSSSHSPFEIAAANAITILNIAGYDFSNQDFSNVSISGANLSYGICEGTNFTNANLQGVDLTDAWLKDANFVNANLANVKFGEIFPLKPEGDKITKIAYSPNGKHFAAEIGYQTVIFENVTVCHIINVAKD